MRRTDDVGLPSNEGLSLITMIHSRIDASALGLWSCLKGLRGLLFSPRSKPRSDFDFIFEGLEDLG